MKKLFNIVSIFFIIIALVQCKKDINKVVVIPDEAKPTAGFTYIMPDSARFTSFQFTSSASNYKQLLWQFGDDSTSTEVSPAHIYKFPGQYHVVLNTSNSQGYWATKEILLNVVDPNFDATKVGENFIKTIGGKLTVSRDNQNGPTSGEGSLMVIDENFDTKFIQSGFAGDLWMRFDFDTALVVGAYTLTSGNDSWDRDPKTWTFQGSVDGIKWITLHSNDQVQWTTDGSQRRSRKVFYFDNYTPYKSYRLNIKADNGSRDFQLADWTINKKQPLRLLIDSTAKGALTVNADNNGGPGANEGSLKLVDNNTSSKFLCVLPVPFKLWMQLKFPVGQIISAYTLTSANDAPERDPKDWNLLASNDGITWVTVDTRTSEVFLARNLTKLYAFNNTTAYTYYRLSVSAIGMTTSTLFQMSEWRVGSM